MAALTGWRARVQGPLGPSGPTTSGRCLAVHLQGVGPSWWPPREQEPSVAEDPAGAGKGLEGERSRWLVG